ncbi:lipocalin family protein [Bdellovibrio bacteriovorus]|uniref:lipocalin family protein n=1 Tax=Bdellovibrio bacteriovorus TaxID=959 RepID=UPI003A8073D4
MKKLILSIFVLGFVSTAVAAPATVPFVDLNKYLGKWFEVASIPMVFQKQCIGNTTAEYASAEDGLIAVVNSCDTQSGERSVAEGRAKVLDKESNSRLKVTFVKIIDWVFGFGGDYWVLDLASDYSYAVVGDPTLQYAWILSRDPFLARETWVSAELKLRSLGYDTCTVLTSVQSGGLSQRIPLCEYVK